MLAAGIAALAPGGVRSDGATAATAITNTAASSVAAAGPDWLQFLDGSSLHGSLRSVGVDNGIQWQHPAAQAVINFRTANLALIGFENSPAVPPISPATCRFRFRNGDELFGRLTSLDTNTVGLETWFADRLQAARRSVQSITVLPPGFKIQFEGPTGLEGWVLGRDPQAWRYRDGALIATGTGTLARDFQLRDSSRLEFDLAWTGPFELILVLYTDALDRLDYNVSSYLLYLGLGFVNVQRVQTGLGVLQLGQAQLPDMLKRNHTHFELRTLKEDATLELWIDGTLAERWKDNRGFAGRGPGIVFFPQLEGAASKISLSNLRVSTWEGPGEGDSVTNSPPAGDCAYLVNHDKVTGELRALHDGKLTVATAQTTLDVPLSRVTKMVLGNSGTNAPTVNPRETRAYFVGGGSVSFQLEKWEVQRVSGDSDVFGHIAFGAAPIRRLQFNLDRSGNQRAETGEPAKDHDDWDE
jgi:hypothetical protein